VELGLALLSLGRSEEAAGHFERAIEWTPGRPELAEHLRGLIENARR
jgi:hypothetical protein